MKRALVLLTVAALGLPAAAAAAGPSVSISSDRGTVSTALGREFDFSTTISNTGSSATGALVAHLNILSVRPGIYVDPEDWSGRRTRYLDPIPAGGSRRVGWHIKAVNGGAFSAYVVVVPQEAGAAPPVPGPEVRIAVRARKTLNAGGVLPLALGIPLALALLWLAVRIARRRDEPRAAVKSA